jgi:hypothetical protein
MPAFAPSLGEMDGGRPEPAPSVDGIPFRSMVDGASAAADESLGDLSGAKPTKTRASRSEKIVCSFAIALLAAGFATGVFAGPNHARPHTQQRVTQALPVQAWDDRI